MLLLNIKYLKFTHLEIFLCSFKTECEQKNYMFSEFKFTFPPSPPPFIPINKTPGSTPLITSLMNGVLILQDEETSQWLVTSDSERFISYLRYNLWATVVENASGTFKNFCKFSSLVTLVTLQPHNLAHLNKIRVFISVETYLYNLPERRRLPKHEERKGYTLRNSL